MINSNVPLKYSVSCYFCNNLFERRLLQDHISQCSQVLEPCPYKCGVYVPRRVRDKHINECLVRRQRRRLSAGNSMEHACLTSSPGSSNQTSSRQSTAEVVLRRKPPNLSYTQHSPTLSTPRNDFNPDTKNLERQLTSHLESCRNIQTELINLKVSHTDLLDYNKEVAITIDKLKLFQNDIGQKNVAEKTKNELQFEKVQLQLKMFEDSINQLRQYVETNSKNETRAFDINRITEHIDKINQIISQDRKMFDMNFASLKDDFLGFKEYLNKENLIVSDIWHEQSTEVSKLRSSIQGLDNDLKDLQLVQHADTFQIKTNTQMMRSTLERLVGVEERVEKMQNEVAQSSGDLRDLVESSRVHHCNIIVSTNGHLIWRIPDFSHQLTEAIKHDTINHSPIFLSSPFGYKLRVEAYFNGKGRWKGRHLIMTLQVLKGEYDQILEWPCNLDTTIILRDQSTNKSESADFVKRLTAKRKLEDLRDDEISEYSCQHIFIPHKVINESGVRYKGNDTMFFEIHVKEKIKK